MKSASDVTSQLEVTCQSADFLGQVHDLVRGWHSEAGFGAKAVVEGVLRFMESHPDLEFGAPGPLVHHLEEMSLELYVPLLLQSLERRPTVHTIRMLNRLINGISGPWRTSLIENMRAMTQRSDIRADARVMAVRFVEQHDEKED